MSDSPGTKLAALWNEEYPRYASSRSRIENAGRWRRREVIPQLPEGWEHPEAFRVQLPHGTTIGQDVVNFLGRKRPGAHRTPLGTGPTAQRLSSRVETFVQEAMDNALKANGEDLWEAILAFACNDGEFGLLVQPRPAHWSNLISFTDPDNDDDIHPTFRRDAKGRGADDEWYAENDKRRSFSVNVDKSKAAFESYLRDAKAKRLPVVIRLLPAGTCLPIASNPEDGMPEAMLVKTRRTVKALEQEGITFTFLGPEMHNQSGVATITSAAQVFTLYELHVGGKVYYEVADAESNESYPTLLNGGVAMVDLEAEYGINRILGGYFYGAHFANETDPAKKGFPFLEPFLGALLGVTQTVSAKVAFVYRHSFYGPAIKLDKELLGAWREIGHPATFEMRPMEMQVVPGEIQDTMPPSVGQDADKLIGFLMSLLDKMSPSAQMDVAGADSGFQGGVQLASLDHMLRQISAGSRAAWKAAAEGVLTVCAAIARKTGEAVPIYVTITKRGDGGGMEQSTAMYELAAEDCQGDYTIDALLPQPKFQNLPLMQAGSGFVGQGLISEITWLEEMAGFEQPEEEQDRKWVERQLKSPEGEQYTLDLAAKLRGNAELAKLQKLHAAGQVTPGGTPNTAMPPRPLESGGPVPTPPNGPMPNGPDTGNPAASALGGMMAGAMQTNGQARVIQATGAGVPTAI